MSFLSSLFNPATGTPANGGAPVAPTQGAPAAATPAVPATPAAPAAPVSPLDQFTSMWQTPLNADGKPQAPAVNQLAQPIFNFDPAAVTASAAKMDFMSGIAPETIQKALSGDPAAFADSINQAVRQAVVGMTMSQGQLINQAVVANNDRVTAAIPNQIKQAQLREVDTDPVFSHPAAQPLVASLKQMAFARDPNASPAEINTMISNYLKGFATAVTENSPEAQKTKAATVAGEQDWSSFLV